MKYFSQFLSAILLLIAFLAFPFFSNAQSNDQPGVVVNLKGDTLHGFINYSDWENNPTSIIFKGTTGSAPQKFTPQDVSYFNVSIGRLVEYKAYTGTVSTDNTDTYRISIGKDSSYRQDTIFLKVIQKGKNLILFSYSDSEKIRFFITTNFSDQPAELAYRVYWNNVVATDSRTEYDNSFKRQLYDVAARAGTLTPELKKDIQKADYKDNDLGVIASKINGGTADDFLKNRPSKAKHVALRIALFGILAIAIIKLSLATFPKAP
jgi:hypothetical protein